MLIPIAAASSGETKIAAAQAIEAKREFRILLPFIRLAQRKGPLAGSRKRLLGKETKGEIAGETGPGARPLTNVNLSLTQNRAKLTPEFVHIGNQDMALAVRTPSGAPVARAPKGQPAVKVIPFPHTPRQSLPADPGTAEESYMAEPPFSPAWHQLPPGKARRAMRPSSPALLIVGATVLFLGAALAAILAV